MHHFLFGSPETIAGTVYGTIVVMGAIAAGSQSGEIRTSHLAAVVAVTVLVLWIAHVYSHALAETIRLARRLDGAELASVARRELAIPLAGLMPVASLALGSIGVLRESTAVWLAMGFGLATLVVDGVRYAAAARLTPHGRGLTVAVNLALGLSLVGLKAGLGH